jgi:hypothetical protein
MRWPRPPKKPGSASNAARSGASICAKASGGVPPLVGATVPIRILSALRTAVVCHATEPPEGETPVCTDELGPVVARTFPPAPAWSANGHRLKAPLDSSRGPEKTWVYGALRVRDGKELTRCAASRTSTNYIALLQDIEADHPTGDMFSRTDHLSSHNRAPTRTWLGSASSAPAGLHSHGSQAFSTCKRAGGACSVVMRLPGQSFATPDEIEQATRVATAQLNRRAQPWIWGRPRHQIIATLAVSFLIAFKERSTRNHIDFCLRA